LIHADPFGKLPRRHTKCVAYGAHPATPRACLGFKTPEEVFYNEIQRARVALQT
jgi:IS30 family transposase